MAKKVTDSVAQGRKNKVSKWHIDLTGNNKVPILEKSPLDKVPPTVPAIVGVQVLHPQLRDTGPAVLSQTCHLLYKKPIIFFAQ